MTDESLVYTAIGKTFAEHRTVNHSEVAPFSWTVCGLAG